MKTIGHRVMMAALAAVVLALPAAAQGTPPASQSLADQARAAQKNKPAPSPAAKVWTNDNIPTTSGISTVGTPATGNGSASAGAEDKSASAQTTPRSPDELRKLEQEWRKKFQDQKDQIALLERELTVSKRENQIRATTYYADAGNRMRYENQAKYAEDDRKYQAETAAKQKELDAAKQKLQDMKDELRKAGLPSSWAE